MRIRNVLGLAVAVPALVTALAAPGDAASPHVVSFGGYVTVTPTSMPETQTLDVCFSAFECANGASRTGAAAGADATGRPVAGLQARATYSEACTAGAIAPIGSADLTGNVYKPLPGVWSQDVHASWFRAGLVAVIQGDAVGVALFTPAYTGVPVCDQPVTVAVAGAVELTA